MLSINSKEGKKSYHEVVVFHFTWYPIEMKYVNKGQAILYPRHQTILSIFIRAQGLFGKA